MIKNIQFSFKVVLLISSLLLLSTKGATYIGEERTLQFTAGQTQDLYFSSPSDYYVATVYTHLNQLLPSEVLGNLSTCSFQNFPSSGYIYCLLEKSPLVSFAAKFKGTQFYLSVYPKGDTGQVGNVSIFFQPLQEVEVNQKLILNYQKHAKMYFRISLTTINGIFKLSSPLANQISEIFIESQNCNDYATQKSYTQSNFAFDIFKECQVVFYVQSKAFNNALEITPVVVQKALLSVSDQFQTLIPSNLPNGVTYTPQYFRIEIEDFKTRFGIAPPLQIYLQLKGVNINEKITVNLSQTAQLPAYSERDASCINVNVCNLFFEVSEGLSFFRYMTVVSNLYVEGVNYRFTALPVSFPAQGYQPTFFKSNRYLEFDYTKNNFLGVGVFYFSFVGRTSGDTATIYESTNSYPFKYSGDYYNENSLTFGNYYVSQPTRIQEALSITRYTEGFEFYYSFVPLYTFTQTSENFIIPQAWSNNTLTSQSFAAQLSSYANVQSATVRIVLIGQSQADSWSFYVTDSTCNLNIFPRSSNYCKSARQQSIIDYSYSIYENKPLYFQLQQNGFKDGYKFSVIFSANCSSGYRFNGSACLSQSSN